MKKVISFCVLGVSLIGASALSAACECEECECTEESHCGCMAEKDDCPCCGGCKEC